MTTQTRFRSRPKPCGCGGYWFPHRITSGSCDYRKDKLKALLCKVRREKGDTLQAVADFLFDAPHNPIEPDSIIPF